MKMEKFLSSKECARIGKIEEELAQKGFSGKPLGYDFFREKRLNDKRVYFLVYDDLKIVLMVAVSDKMSEFSTSL